MLTVAILINGQPILARSAVNRLAEAGCYVVDDGSRIIHDPADGAVALAIKLLGTIKDQPDQVLHSEVSNRHQAARAGRLPSELAGIDPEMTGGLSASAYLRKMRGAEDR